MILRPSALSATSSGCLHALGSPRRIRAWRGFHHHATLAIAAYGFLVSERSLIPPAAPPLRPERHVSNSIAAIKD
ncbi:hypothetical protein GOC40_33240 [Sinorhizobium meliloti]|nr:hypothetical protein [Sinorhizobium meliloti]MDX0222680.1 hypothetical protein [Sinorhizobium meliloti]